LHPGVKRMSWNKTQSRVVEFEPQTIVPFRLFIIILGNQLFKKFQFQGAEETFSSLERYFECNLLINLNGN
jgi:hypothetical protein